jgi:hypothetical protein
MLHVHISVNAFKFTTLVLYSVVKVKEGCLQTTHKSEPIYFVDSIVWQEYLASYSNGRNKVFWAIYSSDS